MHKNYHNYSIPCATLSTSSISTENIDLSQREPGKGAPFPNVDKYLVTQCLLDHEQDKNTYQIHIFQNRNTNLSHSSTVKMEFDIAQTFV